MNSHVHLFQQRMVPIQHVLLATLLQCNAHMYNIPFHPLHSNVTDMQQWIGAINKSAALYSSAPLAAPMSSSVTFVRPTFPLAPTRNTLEQQVHVHVHVCMYVLATLHVAIAGFSPLKYMYMYMYMYL